MALNNIKETRPARAAVELLIRGKQIKAATNTGKSSGVMLVQQSAGKGMLGALLPQNVELLGGQDFSPFLFGFYYFHNGLCRLREWERRKTKTGYAAQGAAHPFQKIASVVLLILHQCPHFILFGRGMQKVTDQTFKR
jgi:hypothetical protein